jgi:hypothetical protein
VIYAGVNGYLDKIRSTGEGRLRGRPASVPAWRAQDLLDAIWDQEG